MPAAGDLAGAMRSFRAAGDVSGMVLSQSAMAVVLLGTGREEEAYEVAGAAARLVRETGLRLAVIAHIAAPTRRSRTRRPPRSGSARRTRRAAAGARAEALDRAIALAELIAASGADVVEA